MARRSTPESGVLKACLDLLAAERIWHMRLNTVGTRVMHYLAKNGEQRRGVIRGLKPGTADILATVSVGCEHFNGAGDGVYVESPGLLWIECKAPSGRQTPEQKQFQAEVEAVGHKYLLIRDAEELKKWIRGR